MKHFSGLEGDYVVDAPANFFGSGHSSRYFPLREAFFAYVDALRALGKSVTVDESSWPVVAVVGGQA